jgi:hypothetical protein
LYISAMCSRGNFPCSSCDSLVQIELKENHLVFLDNFANTQSDSSIGQQCNFSMLYRSPALKVPLYQFNLFNSSDVRLGTVAPCQCLPHRQDVQCGYWLVYCILLLIDWLSLCVYDRASHLCQVRNYAK